MRWRAPAAASGAWLLAASADAHAHLLATGLGALADGAAHFLLSFDDLLAVAATALLGGLNGARAARLATGALPTAWLAAGTAGFASAGPSLPAGTTALTLLALGILVAADRRLAPALVATLAAMTGALHGWLNGVAIASARGEALTLAGIAAAVLAAAAVVATPASRLQARAARIAMRVAGSWIAAIGLLYLGWAASGRA